MAKRTATAVATGENVAAALARIEQSSNQLTRDHGVVASAIDVQRQRIDDLEDELAEIQEEYAREVLELRSDFKRRYNEVAVKYNDIVGKFNKVAEITGNKTEATIKIE